VPIWVWGALGVVAAVLVADRVAALIAEHAAQARIASRLPGMQQVRVRAQGGLFTPQAARGHYRVVRVRGRIELGVLSDVPIEVHLRGVHLRAGDLRAGDLPSSGVPVERVDAEVLLPYAELPRLTRVAGLTITPRGGTLVVSAPLQVPGAGAVRVNGHGTVHVVDGAVRLHVSGMRIARLPVPRLVVAQMSRALSTAIVVPPLPYGLRIASVATRADGISVRCFGVDAVLQRPDSARSPGGPGVAPSLPG
jgi:hypothetical protein